MPPPEIYPPGALVWVYATLTNPDSVQEANPQGLVDDETLTFYAEDPTGLEAAVTPKEHVSLGVYRVRLRLSVGGGSYSVKTSADGPADTRGEISIRVDRSLFE